MSQEGKDTELRELRGCNVDRSYHQAKRRWIREKTKVRQLVFWAWAKTFFKRKKAEGWPDAETTGGRVRSGGYAYFGKTLHLCDVNQGTFACEKIKEKGSTVGWKKLGCAANGRR